MRAACGTHLPSVSSVVEPPLPIPNREVKRGSAEDTFPEAGWENRSTLGQRALLKDGAFYIFDLRLIRGCRGTADDLGARKRILV